MEDTGERYTTARMYVLGVAEAAGTIPKRPEGYRLIGGGSHPDTAAVHNVLLAAGITAPYDDQPFSDALLYGLGGGTGFLYAVFEYRGLDPMLSLGVRHTMMGHEFARAALERSGVAFDLIQTGSADKADRAIDEALDEGIAPLVTVDDPALPYSGMPEMYRGLSAQQVAIVGATEVTVWIDDRTLIEMPRQALRDARASYKKPRHHMMVVRGGGTADDLRRGVRAAIRANIDNLHESPYKGFASNWGFAGMEKWAGLVAGGKDPKRWERLFATDALLFNALVRVYESIEWWYTPPAAGRGIYADFLDEVAVILNAPAFETVAGRYRDLGERWSDLAAFALSGHPLFDRYLELHRRYRSLLREQRGTAGPARRAVFDEKRSLDNDVSFPEGFADGHRKELASRIGDLAAAERLATDELERALAIAAE